MGILLEFGLFIFFMACGLGVMSHGFKIIEINHYHKDVVQETRNARVKKR